VDNRLAKSLSLSSHYRTDYLQEYTHWAFTDVDMVVGDLERYINHDELHHYDVVTYRYHDDNTQLFFHGQFTMVRISPATSMVWLGCEYFGGSSEPSRGLLYELRLRQFLHEREIRRGRSLPMPFHVADEGCMTRTFVSKKDLRIKYVPKLWNDRKGGLFYLNICAPPSGQGRGRAVLRRCLTNEKAQADFMPEETKNRALQRCIGYISGCSPSSETLWPSPGSAVRTHDPNREEGEFLPLPITHECAFPWIAPFDQFCVNSSAFGPSGLVGSWSFYYLNGAWFRRRYISDPQIEDGALLHLQRWKNGGSRKLVVEAPRVGENATYFLEKVGFRRVDIATGHELDSNAGFDSHQ